MSKVKYDFSGYATKSGIKCSDGRVILPDAFAHQDGATVPLVWQHLHNEPGNILGHAILENRRDGVYCYGKFNNSESGQNAKEAVEHGDISSLSIYANQLKEQAKHVKHGAILEVSLVLSGANREAVIDNLNFAHSDGYNYTDEEEAIIYFGEYISHADKGEVTKSDDSKGDDRTIEDVFNTLNEEQKNVVYALIAQAVSGDDEGDDKKNVKHSSDLGDDATVQDVFDTLDETQKNVVYAMIGYALEEADTDDEVKHSNYGGDINMKRNVFDQTYADDSNVLSHDQLTEIVQDAKKFGSLKESFIAHAENYGFDPIDVLFPDARYLGPADGPEMYKREDTWVDTLLGEATKTPFARIKTMYADITADEARAKGYVTGTLKKDEVIPLFKRVTTPTTIYKKQKLDRDDMVDITDFDVVVWLKKEMRMMLNEELARAILIGDGRTPSEEDKINELNIRPIAHDNADVYINRTVIENDASVDDIIDEMIRARKHYKGSGVPTLWTSTDLLTEMLLIKDKQGRRIYSTVQELASVLRVSKIVEVEVMNDAKRSTGDDTENEILGIIVNMKDYTIGADKGGAVALFDDFDIDYNQHKYLIETRCSGALTKPKSALVIERAPVEDEGDFGG